MAGYRDAETSSGAFPAGEGHRQKTLEVMNEWRIKTLNTVLTIGAAFGLVSIVSFYVGSRGEARQLSVELFFAATYALILGLAFYRRIDWRIRGWGFLTIIYLIGIIAMTRGGLAGAGREYLMLIPILATILISVRAGIATAVLSLLLMAGFSFIADAGYLRSLLIYEQNPVDLTSWLQEVAYSVVLMGVSTALLILFNRYLLRMLAAERAASRALEQARDQLEEYSLKLEEKVGQRTAELAEAYQTVEQSNQRMEQELKLAGSIQAGFMASELPQIAGWQRAARLIPARQTSGDFYDIYPLGKDRYAILVADVVDKGVGAALFMALCWALLHTYASQHPDRPDLVVQKVNRRLFRDAHTGQYVTLFYGVLDARAGEMWYCNAGHNPPYLFRNGETLEVQSLHYTGTPLGVFQETSWKVRSIRVQVGDVLVLYTDGVTEAENDCQELFGSERLAGVVRENIGKSAQEVHEAIIQKLCQFTGDLSQCDDITLMVLVCTASGVEEREGRLVVPRRAI